jgi:hypothetical protein
MTMLGQLLGADVAQPIQALGNVLDRLFTSDDERLSRTEALTRLAQQPHLAQIELNKLEAQHRSIFVAGWRPFIGWVCGAGLCWEFLGHPVFEWVVALWLPGRGIQTPAIVTDHLIELVIALLGLGAMRSVEKLAGRAR